MVSLLNEVVFTMLVILVYHDIIIYITQLRMLRTFRVRIHTFRVRVRTY